MSKITHLIHSVPADRSLEVLTNSMWSTMMVTGIFFISFLFVYLGIKVKKSIHIESSDAGPVEISFLFSLSGVRYMINHIRHHLFETPLTPRRRFSSLFNMWLPQFLKRASFSFMKRDMFLEEVKTVVLEKGRRNSSFQTDLNFSRKSSSSSKSKRLSVPNIKSSSSSVAVNPNNQTNIVITENSSVPMKISRRNTLPYIPPPLASQSLHKLELQNENIDVTYFEGKSNVLNPVLSIIPEEEITEIYGTVNINDDHDSSHVGSGCMPIAEEDEISLEDDNNCESEFSEVISEQSNYILSESDEISNECDTSNIPIQTKSNSVNNEPESSSTSQLSPETASPKNNSSFRSSYFNYLPESIFGYSTGITKTNINIPSTETNEAPPGFSKRSVSHDYTNSPSTSRFTDTQNDFSYHQPLYARRRTETSKILSEAAKPFIPLNFLSTSKSDEVDMLPNRSNASSPCLIELQNTDDLFAPINWSFSSPNPNDDIRKSWDSVDSENIFGSAGNNDSRLADSETKKRKSTSSFSFLQ